MSTIDLSMTAKTMQPSTPCDWPIRGRLHQGEAGLRKEEVLAEAYGEDRSEIFTGVCEKCLITALVDSHMKQKINWPPVSRYSRRLDRQRLHLGQNCEKLKEKSPKCCVFHISSSLNDCMRCKIKMFSNTLRPFLFFTHQLTNPFSNIFLRLISCTKKKIKEESVWNFFTVHLQFCCTGWFRKPWLFCRSVTLEFFVNEVGRLWTEQKKHSYLYLSTGHTCDYTLSVSISTYTHLLCAL